eukprot:NODE_130_length_18488_cov_0.389961.p7 type:complete len:197 gc:universal NODE_130_length_18488_cov_0.389961:18262-17672(-)
MLKDCRLLLHLEDFEIKSLFDDYQNLDLKVDEEIALQSKLLTEFIANFYEYCSDLQLPIINILVRIKQREDLLEVQELLATHLTYINFYSLKIADIEQEWTDPYQCQLGYDKDLNNNFTVILLKRMDRFGMQDVIYAYNRSKYLKPAYLHIIYHSSIDDYFTNDAKVLLGILKSDFGAEENNAIHNWVCKCLSKFS